MADTVERIGRLRPTLVEDGQGWWPLRAQTMQGERVTLAASELVEDPWEITIEMTLIPNNGTAKSESLTWDAIEAALDYGPSTASGSGGMLTMGASCGSRWKNEETGVSGAPGRGRGGP